MAYARYLMRLAAKRALISLLGRLLSCRRSAKPATVERVLVLVDSAFGLGDVIMMSPILRHLAAHVPVELLTSHADFLDPGPLPVTWIRCRGLGDYRARVAEAAERGWPVLVPRYAVPTLAFLLATPRLPPLVAQISDGAALDCMDGSVHRLSGHSYAQRTLDVTRLLCRRLGLPDPAGEERFPPRTGMLDAAALPAGAPLIGVAPWATGWTRRWPLEKFAAAIDGLAVRYPGARFVLLGSPSERPIGDRLRGLTAAPGHVHNLMGNFDLAGTATAIRACRLLLSCDNGLMHFANALGVPIVAVFGTTAPETRLGGSLWQALYRPELCPTGRAPCHDLMLPNAFCTTGHECMRLLDSERMVAAAQSFLETGTDAR